MGLLVLREGTLSRLASCSLSLLKLHVGVEGKTGLEGALERGLETELLCWRVSRVGVSSLTSNRDVGNTGLEGALDKGLLDLLDTTSFPRERDVAMIISGSSETDSVFSVAGFVDTPSSVAVMPTKSLEIENPIRCNVERPKTLRVHWTCACCYWQQLLSELHYLRRSFSCFPSSKWPPTLGR